MSKFWLMNKNTKIALLTCVNDNVYIEEMYTDRLPYVINNIEQWLFSRFTIVGRNNLFTMAKIAGMSDREAFLKLSKAISVTDTLWVNDIENETTWEQISPYSNRISRIIADIAIDGIKLYKNQNLASPSPQYRIGGSIDKCIKRIDGTSGLFLFKTNGELWQEVTKVRPYSEYFASQIINKLDMNISNVNYNIIEKTTEDGYVKPYSYCKIFTSEKYGLVEYCDSTYRNTTMQELLTILKRNKDSKNLKILCDLLLVDSIILNPDRHMGNFGFIINNDTFKIIQIAPIYDNDCSLGSLLSIQNKTFEQAYFEAKNNFLPKTGLGNYDEQALMVMTKPWYNRLKTIGKISLHRGNAKSISTERLNFMEYLVNRRIQEIVALVEEHYNI